ncbi:MAG: RodZ domain-containing protein [Solirubrobacterales bacterium]
MATGIGERLRAARIAQDLDLEQVEDRTKIAQRYLRALEDERWEVLPGAAYARAFLHTYAELLGLDADAMVAEYRRDSSSREAQPEAEPVAQLPPPERRGPRLPGRAVARSRLGRGAIAALAVVAVVGIVILVAPFGGSDDETGEPAERAATPESEPEDAPSARETPAEPPPRATLSLTTTGTVWVCLVDERGRPRVEGVTLPPGEEQGPFRGEEFELGLGNGQVELEANGEPVPILAAAEPQGYRVTPEGARELSPADRPTCG